jgi:hypothetical protein
MADVAQQLAQSRQAHQQAKKATGANRLALFQTALGWRIAARTADPDRTDPAWLDDAQHPAMAGENTRRLKRVPGLTAAEVAAKQDTDLEAYFRLQLGEGGEPQDKPVDPEIVPPRAWEVAKAGIPANEGDPVCPQGHSFQMLSFDQRTCRACGQVEELRPTMAVEDTEAFQQHKKEQL